METGPLIAAFNASIARLSAIEKDLEANAAQRNALIAERNVLLRDMEQARNVIAHLAPGDPTVEVPYSPQIRPRRRRAIRESSSVGQARRVLRSARAPMHIDDIIKMIGQMFGAPVNKATLVSNLSRYVNAGDTFVRPEPSMYALKDNASDKDKEIRLVG